MMGILFVAKTFGRYRFFKTEEERNQFLKTLPEWEQKYVNTYEVRFGKVV